MKKRKNKFPFAIIFGIFFAVFIVTALGFIFSRFLKTSDYFTVREVIGNGIPMEVVSHLKGKNIFAVDMRGQSVFLAERYPEFSRIYLVRKFPDALEIIVKRRIPVAIVRVHTECYVDEGGVLFTLKQGGVEKTLPVILGLYRKIPKATFGYRYNIPELFAALHIIRDIESQEVLSQFYLKQIDVTDRNNMRAVFSHRFLSDMAGVHQAGASTEIEVRLDAQTQQRQIRVLSEVLDEMQHEFANVEYVDLRFNEPVIRLRDKSR